MELDAFKVALDDWLGEHEGDLAPHLQRGRNLGRTDGPPQQGQAVDLRRGLHADGLARARGRARRLLTAPCLPRRGTHRPRPRRARHLLHARGAGTDDDRLRARSTRGCHGAAAPAGRRSVVPGLLGTGHGEQPRLPHVPRHAHRRRLEGHGPEGLDEPGAVRPPLHPPDPDGNARIGPPWDHRVVRRHGEPRHHRASDRNDARCAGVLRGLLRRRDGAARPTARRGGRWLVDRHGPVALRAEYGAVAPGGLSAAAAAAAGLRRRRRERSTRAPSARSPSCCGPSGPGRARPNGGSRPATSWVPRPPSTRSSWRRPSRPCSTSSPRASVQTWPARTTR